MGSHFAPLNRDRLMFHTGEEDRNGAKRSDDQVVSLREMAGSGRTWCSVRVTRFRLQRNYN